MIVARHRERDLAYVEAYDEGVGLPLLRHPDGAWELAGVDPEDLWNNYTDVADPSERTVLLDDARRACLMLEKRLKGLELDRLTVAEIREALARKGDLVLAPR